VPQPVQQVEVVRVEPETVVPQYTDFDYFVLGYNHQIGGEYYEAIVDYTRTIQMNPERSSAWLNRGVAYEQLNNDYRAMQDYNRFLNRDGMTVINHRGTVTGARLYVEMAEDRVYEINFYARAGQTVSISAEAQAPDIVDPLIVVVDADGNPVAARDDVLRQDGSLISMDSHIRNWEVLRSGQYTLRVSHAGGGSHGTLELNVDIRN
jgi:tetratricopeptide (TPR) repeat protein